MQALRTAIPTISFRAVRHGLVEVGHGGPTNRTPGPFPIRMGEPHTTAMPDDPSGLAFIHEAGPTGSRPDLVFDQVIARIEPITRFDRQSLSQLGSQERIAQGNARWRSTIAINTQGHSGTGGLGSNVIDVSGASNLTTEVGKAVEAAWDELPARIDRWLGEYGSSNQELTAEYCFDGPVTYGYQYQCQGCGGRGENQCTRCSGQGQYTCTGCQGDGTNRCFTCGGSKTIQCGTCSGRGTHMIHQSRQVYDSATNSYHTEYYTENQRCSSCGGQGSTTCTGCYGKGTVDCSICFGSGKERCTGCSGSGKITCSTCRGTGIKHETQTISCHVTHRWQVVIQDSNEEVNARLAKLELGPLAELGRISVDQPERGRDFVERRYRFSVDIAELSVGVVGREVELTGFGKTAKVYDFKNIAGILLQADLAELQAQLAREPRFAMQGSVPLTDAVKQCLDSEANAIVGEVESNDPRALKALVEKQFAGALSVEYAKAASAALRTSLHRLFFPAVLFYAGSVALLPTVVFLLAQLTDWGITNRVASAAAGLAVGLVAWIVVERTTRKGFTEAFGASHARTVDRLLGKRGVLGRWRVGVGLVGLGLLGVASLIR